MVNGALPSGWSLQRLGDLFDFKGGGTPDKKNPAYWGGDIPWASVKDIKTKYLNRTIDRITEKGLTESAANLAKPGDLVLLTRIEPGKVAIAKILVAVNQDCKIAKPKESVDLAWAYYMFLENEREFIKRSSGTTVLGIRINDVKEITVALPPLEEQGRIVAKIETLFSELDKGIEALKTAREQLKVYRQAVLKHAFEGKLTAKWREENADKLEPPEQLLTHIQQERQARYQQQLQDWKAAVKAWEKNGKEGKKPTKPKLKELLELSREELKQLPDLPTGYFYTYLSNLGELGRGKSKHRPRNDPRLFGGRYPFLQTGEVKAANRVVDSYSETYSDFGLEQSRLWSKGTLCITIAANIAETAFLGFDACFPDSVVGFTSLENIVLPEYIELFIKAVRVRIEAYAPATAQKNINLSTLENLVVPLCSLEEQRQLIGQLEAQFSAINENESEITAALLRSETLRQSIMKKAFSGQLVPQDTNDEPASILLERIRTEKAVQSKANSKRPAKQGH